MKKIFETFLITSLILFAFILNYKCYAIDMNLSNTNTNSANSGNNVTNSFENNLENSTANNVTITSSPQVQSTSNQKVGLSTEGYISIILIAIGLVLIFLGIAIIIRFK